MKGNAFVSAEDYPYTGVQDDCLTTLKELPEVATMASYKVHYEPKKGVSPDLIKKELTRGGPVAGAISANSLQFKNYKEGILTKESCDSLPDGGQDIDHAISIVGFGETAEGLQFWILANSWSPKWGELGFCRVEM